MCQVNSTYTIKPTTQQETDLAQVGHPINCQEIQYFIVVVKRSQAAHNRYYIERQFYSAEKCLDHQNVRVSDSSSSYLNKKGERFVLKLLSFSVNIACSIQHCAKVNLDQVCM